MKKLLFILFFISANAYGQRNTFFYSGGHFQLTVSDSTGNELGHIFYNDNNGSYNDKNPKVVMEWFSTKFFAKYWELNGAAIKLALELNDTLQTKRNKEVFDSLYNKWQ